MSEAVALSNGIVTVRMHPAAGAFDLLDAESRTVLAGAAIGVVLADGTALSGRGIPFRLDETPGRIEDTLGGASVLTVHLDFQRGISAHLTIAAYDGRPFVVLGCELHNGTPDPIRVARFDILHGAQLDLGSPPSSWRFYKHGWQSWSPTLVLACAGEDVPLTAPVIAPGTQPESIAGRFVSEIMTAIFSPASSHGVVAGFITTGDQLSQLWLDRDASTLTAASYPDGITVPPGGSLASERLLIEPTKAPLEAMERFGDALGRSMGARPSANVASGWCSWYYYWQGVTEEAVLTNLGQLRQRRNELPLEYVQVDDGWQAEIGDWLTINEKFPHGLKWLVDQIHKEGFQAGLWLAPFLIGAKSQLWRDHPEWAVQHRPGRPSIAMQNWGEDCYALDLTRPEVIDWLKLVFRTICEEWGFDYVKIDFIYAGAVDGIRHDAEVTRAQAYRRGLEASREAVGDRFILACGNPIGPSVGLVDGARISPDVAPFWHPPGTARDPTRNRMSEPSALNAIRNTISRWWTHGRLWQNDPDCFLARDSETALTPDEVRSLATVIAMSGGMVLDSDDLARLSDERREWLSMLLPPYGRAARPLDLFESEIPRLLELDVGSHRMLTAFNWGDEAANSIPIGLRQPAYVYDVWEKQYHGLHSGGFAAKVRPHGCALFRITRSTTRPQIVGSTFHMLQGAYEIESEEWDDDRLCLSVALRPVGRELGELLVTGPWQLDPVQPSPIQLVEERMGCWKVLLTVKEKTQITIPYFAQE